MGGPSGLLEVLLHDDDKLCRTKLADKGVDAAGCYRGTIASKGVTMDSVPKR